MMEILDWQLNLGLGPASRLQSESPSRSFWFYYLQSHINHIRENVCVRIKPLAWCRHKLKEHQVIDIRLHFVRYIGLKWKLYLYYLLNNSRVPSAFDLDSLENWPSKNLNTGKQKWSKECTFASNSFNTFRDLLKNKAKDPNVRVRLIPTRTQDWHKPILSI